MKDSFIFSVFILHIYLVVSIPLDSDSENAINYDPETKDKLTKQNPDDCWLNLEAAKHFRNMKKFEGKHSDTREKFKQAFDTDAFDNEMLQTLVENRGVAPRAHFSMAAKGQTGRIPSGLNLGGRCMLRMKDSIVFFHRMKLRNDTHFRINYLHNDFENMLLVARLSLNDLHLIGNYERALTDDDPSIVFYTPTYGTVEILLKKVEYKVEGRYRLLQNHLTVELIISELKTSEVLLVYMNNSTSKNNRNDFVKLEESNIAVILSRLRVDLDLWLKDYFNDYLMYSGLPEKNVNKNILKYDHTKATIMNDYMDSAIDAIRNKVYKTGADNINMPKFTIYGQNGIEIRLKQGKLRGLETLYRRAVSTGTHDLENKLRHVNAVVGFSKLKVVYSYDIIAAPMEVPLSGQLIMSADDMIGQLDMELIEEPETVDLLIHIFAPTKSESLTIEGPASTKIANFKHLLENQIIALISNAMIHNIKLLDTITKCEPFLPGQINPKELQNRNKAVHFETTSHINTEASSKELHTSTIVTDLIEESDSATKEPTTSKSNHNSEETIIHSDGIHVTEEQNGMQVHTEDVEDDHNIVKLQKTDVGLHGLDLDSDSQMPDPPYSSQNVENSPQEVIEAELPKNQNNADVNVDNIQTLLRSL